MSFRHPAGKYKNNWCTSDDGIRFQSQGEMARWNFLKDMQSMGKITRLRRQIKFDLMVSGQKICAYIADFGYVVCDFQNPFALHNETIEDFKGLETPEFKLKKKLMKAIHGIDIKVVKKPTEGYK